MEHMHLLITSTPKTPYFLEWNQSSKYGFGSITSLGGRVGNGSSLPCPKLTARLPQCSQCSLWTSWCGKFHMGQYCCGLCTELCQFEESWLQSIARAFRRALRRESDKRQLFIHGHGCLELVGGGEALLQLHLQCLHRRKAMPRQLHYTQVVWETPLGWGVLGFNAAICGGLLTTCMQLWSPRQLHRAAYILIRDTNFSMCLLYMIYISFIWEKRLDIYT
jgi:hypothetical protein